MKLHNKNNMTYNSLLLVMMTWTALLLFVWDISSSGAVAVVQAQELLSQNSQHHHKIRRLVQDEKKTRRQLSIWDTIGDIWNGIFDIGNDDNNNNNNSTDASTQDNSTNSGGTFADWWNSIFGNNDDDNDQEQQQQQQQQDDPFSSILEDLNNITDTIFSPIQDAIDATEDSEEPLLDFLRELLDQPSSQEPVRDYIREAFNRTDTPVLDFLAELFDNSNSNASAVDDFVRDILDGNTNPLQNFLNNIVSDDVVFETKDCSVENANAPACAYNWAGDQGVWVCRTLYNTLTGEPNKETICAPPEFTLKDNDVCGSCDGTYPEPCNCDCDLDPLDGAGAGTYVELGPTTQCVDSKWAIGNVGRFQLECQEQCA